MKALVALVLACHVGGAAAESLGRLFFTPEQRAQLEKTRRQRPEAADTEPDRSPPEHAPSAAVTYSGLVRNAGGRVTVWVNNLPLHDRHAASAGEPRARVHDDGSATVTLPRRGNVRLKVGQTAELASGRIEEGYARRPSAPAVGATDPPPAKDTLRLRRRVSDDRRLPADDGPP